MSDVGAILASIGQASYEWDISGDKIAWSENFAELVGFKQNANISSARAFEKLLSSDSPQTRFAVIQTENEKKPDESGCAYQCMYAVNPSKLKSGKIVWLEDIGRWYPGENGKPARAEGIVRIVNERRKREESLRRKSEIDELTGLANRRFLEDKINQTAERCFIDNKSAAFMLISLLDFERINNTYGFATGDEVLVQVTKLLSKKLRSRDLAARFSGAKFGLLIHDCKAEDINVAGRRLLDAINGQVLKTSKGPVALKAALGSCILPMHGRSHPEAIAAATAALDRARSEFGTKMHLHDPDPQSILQREADAKLLTRFVKVLEKDAMHLAFQPVFDPEENAPAFHEALLRMDGIGDEVTQDAKFVRLAEDLGLMRLLDLKTLDMGIETLKSCPDSVLSINTTHESLENGEWIKRLSDSVKNRKNLANRLIIELTESHLPGDIQETRKAVAFIQELGCRVAIDDFGVGYTSFSHLRDLGVDIIKIDGSFARNLASDSRNSVFLQSMQQLASAFGVKTVVEWVEDVETAVKLQEWGFDYLQGNLYGLPSGVLPWKKKAVKKPAKPVKKTGT